LHTQLAISGSRSSGLQRASVDGRRTLRRNPERREPGSSPCMALQRQRALTPDASSNSVRALLQSGAESAGGLGGAGIGILSMGDGWMQSRDMLVPCEQSQFQSPLQVSPAFAHGMDVLRLPGAGAGVGAAESIGIPAAEDAGNGRGPTAPTVHQASPSPSPSPSPSSRSSTQSVGSASRSGSEVSGFGSSSTLPTVGHHHEDSESIGSIENHSWSHS